MSLDIGDKSSVLLAGLSGFWGRFFKDTSDLDAFYLATEELLGQVYLDLLTTVLNTGLIDSAVFNREAWKLLLIREDECRYSLNAIFDQPSYLYPLPNNWVKASNLQNTIISPDVVFEDGVDYTTVSGDSTLYFNKDPFTSDVDRYMPIPGIAWRYVKIPIGGAVEERAVNDFSSLGVNRGDRIHFLAKGSEIYKSGMDGGVTVSSTTTMFTGTGVGLGNVGDIIAVAGSSVWSVNYLIKSIITADSVLIETDMLGLPSSSSTNALHWSLWRSIPIDNPEEIHPLVKVEHQRLYYENKSNLDLLGGPTMYAILRSNTKNSVSSVSLVYIRYTEDPYVLDPPVAYDLGVKHIVAGSVYVNARKGIDSTSLVVEGVDYSVDYTQGVLYQLTKWSAGSSGKITYQWSDVVCWSVNGVFDLLDAVDVKQLSLWAPTVDVDKFMLYTNYGQLVGRFNASSEEYKSFLRGVMYLYISGPIFERIESALNLALGLPVIKTEGEVLEKYSDGLTSQGSNAQVIAATSAVIISPAEYLFTLADVGGHFILRTSAFTGNEGTYKIRDIDTLNNMLYLDVPAGLTDDIGVEWAYSRDYCQTITTNRNTYVLPYTVPVKPEFKVNPSISNYSPSFFSALTTIFTVTDYIEDPNWWHDKYIPGIIWADTPLERRLASTRLYAHVVGALDRPRVGDPGLYIGADNDGVVLDVRDNIGNPMPLWRYCTAFVLFDKFLKFHMFYIGINKDVELDAQFADDLEDLILITKPTYTYPYVVPSRQMLDNVTMYDDVLSLGYTLHFGGELADSSDAIMLNQNVIRIGDTNYPMNVGDFYHYDAILDSALPGAPAGPVLAGDIVELSTIITSDARPYHIRLHGSVAGGPLLEGRDYKIDWRPLLDDFSPNPSFLRLTALTDWDGTDFPNITVYYTVLVANTIYNTIMGDTPIMVGGTNPMYNRHAGLNPDDPGYAIRWALLRTEHLDRSVQLTVDDSGMSYTY
jgi:hypothetical protein